MLYSICNFLYFYFTYSHICFQINIVIIFYNVVNSFLGCFEDENVSHVEGDINPVRDIEIINEELRLKDEEYLLNIIDKMERTVIRGGDKKAKPEYVSNHFMFLL